MSIPNFSRLTFRLDTFIRTIKKMAEIIIV